MRGVAGDLFFRILYYRAESRDLVTYTPGRLGPAGGLVGAAAIRDRNEEGWGGARLCCWRDGVRAGIDILRHSFLSRRPDLNTIVLTPD